MERAENFLRRGPFTRSSRTFTETSKWAQGECVRVGERKEGNGKESQMIGTEISHPSCMEVYKCSCKPAGPRERSKGLQK